MNLNQSKTKFSIQINPNHFDLGFIGLILIENYILYVKIGLTSQWKMYIREICGKEQLRESLRWMKFIPGQSKLFRFIPISVSEPMRIIPNQSEKLFVSHLIKNVQKSILLNPINSETSIRMNPKQSETKFSISINPTQSDFSIKINLNHFNLGFIRIDLDWKLGFGLVRIYSDWCHGINRIKSDQFLTVFYQTWNKTFFGLVRNDSH